MRAKKNNSHDSNMLPVIKFSMDNRVIYHNVAAMPLLSQWNCELNKKVPAAILKKHQSIFDAKNKSESNDIAILYKEYVFCFSLIAFPEAGFTGLYGYSVQEAGLFEKRQQEQSSKTEA